jgi:hypothetical protein
MDGISYAKYKHHVISKCVLTKARTNLIHGTNFYIGRAAVGSHGIRIAKLTLEFGAVN